MVSMLLGLSPPAKANTLKNREDKSVKIVFIIYSFNEKELFHKSKSKAHASRAELYRNKTLKHNLIFTSQRNAVLATVLQALKIVLIKYFQKLIMKKTRTCI
jgi:hypothetical protein